MSKAVPWSTEVRMNGSPRFTLTLLAQSWTLIGMWALVVVHAYHRVELAVDGLVEDRVRGHRPGGVYPIGPRGLDGRSDLLLLLVAKQSAVAGVGIQSGDPDAGRRKSPGLEAVVCEPDLGQDVVLGHVVAGHPKRAVSCEVHHTEGPRHEHRRHLLGAGLALENLHVADVPVTGQGARLLVDRRRRDGLNLAGCRKLAGFEDPLHRCLARHRGNLALGDGGVVEVLEVEDVYRAGGTLDLVEGVGQPGRNGRAYQLQRLVHGAGAAHHEGAALLVHGLVEKGFGRDLRPDSRRVTHGDGDEGFLSPGFALR